MRILIVSQYYPPEAVPIPADIAHELAARGHSVRVLTGYPNYPTGRIFPGYRQRWRGREIDGAVSLCRVPLLASHSRSLIKRLANYASFAVTSATARRYAQGADIVYVYATQMTAALGPWLWRLTGGPPYVLHVQDLWPDSISASSIVAGSRAARWVDRMLTPWLTSVYRRAEAVIVIAPTMVETLASRGVSRSQVKLVFNWSDEREVTPRRARRARADGKRSTRIVYAGNVGDMQDLETAIRAVHTAQDAGVELRIVGDGVAKRSLEQLTRDLGCENIFFEDPVPRDMMSRIYADADFGLVTLKDRPVFRGTIPSKFQTVLAHGLPVITTVQGDVRAFVERAGVGLTAEAESVNSLETAFRQAAATDDPGRWDMASRAIAAYDANFSRESGITAFEDILMTAATPAKGRNRQ